MAPKKKPVAEKYPPITLTLRPDQPAKLDALAYVLRAKKSEVIQEALDMLLDVIPMTDEEIERSLADKAAGKRPPLLANMTDADEASERVRVRLRRWRESNPR